MKPKQVLSPSEIKSLKDEKAELEATIKEIESGAGAGTQASAIDKARIAKHAEYLGKKIHEGSPQKFKRGTEKDRLAARADELREKISEGMPTEEQMRRPVRYPGIIRKNFEWQKRNSANIREYKQIMRRLEPNDPGASSVETFRKR